MNPPSPSGSGTPGTGSGSGRRFRFRLSVSARIFIILLTLGLIIFLVVGGISFFLLQGLGQYATEMSGTLGSDAADESAQALRDNSELYLLRLVTDQADISNLFFERIRDEMDVLTTQAGLRISDPEQEIPQIYSKDTPPDRQGEHGVFISADADTTGRDPDARIASMEEVIAPIYQSDHHLTATYVADSNGSLYFFPWTNQIPDGFDPRTREWYSRAVSSGQLVWSDPYLDAVGNGQMITASRMVRSGSNQTWVIGSDLTIDTIMDRIIGTQMGDRGYAFLVNQNGAIIARPDSSYGDLNQSVFPDENLLLSTNEDVRSVAGEMTAGFSGVMTCHFSDGDRYIAYAPVKSVNWSVGIILPVESVIAPSMMIKRAIEDTSTMTRTEIERHIIILMQALAATFALLFVVILLFSLFISRYVSGPVRILKVGAERIGEGDLSTPVSVKTGDEFEDLADAFNQMAARLSLHIITLRDTTAREERFRHELEIARTIQLSFLPDHPPAIEGFEMAAYASPAQEVGGDFHDFIPLPGGGWGVAIADVSGKGVPAALFMALSRTLLRVSSGVHSEADAIITRTNNLISRDAEGGMFVTLFFMLVTPGSRNISWVNAGHNPPVVIPADPAADPVFLGDENPAPGLIEEFPYPARSSSLDPGDLVVLYTDGITEAMDPDGNEYGTDRFISTIRLVRDRPLDSVKDAILADIARFVREAPQSDDISLILIRVN